MPPAQRLRPKWLLLIILMICVALPILTQNNKIGFNVTPLFSWTNSTANNNSSSTIPDETNAVKLTHSADGDNFTFDPTAQVATATSNTSRQASPKPVISQTMQPVVPPLPHRVPVNMAAMDCFDEGVARYWDHGAGRCLSFATAVTAPQSPLEAIGHAEVPDPTLVPMAATFAPALSRLKPEEGTAAKVLVSERFVPSRHSRWLLEDWRLWEGELPCSNRAELRGLATPHTGLYARSPDGRLPAAYRKGDPPPPANADPRHIPFATVGAHRPHLPNSLYELENVCIDEESGRLLTFAAASAGADKNDRASIVPPIVDKHNGFAEHPFSFPYIGIRRFLGPHNRETVPIVLPSADAAKEGNGPSWRSAIAASLEAHQRTVRNGSQGASVLFVEDRALMVGIFACAMSNPSHAMLRITAAAYQSRLLGTRSHIYLSDVIGLETRAAYATLYARNGMSADSNDSNSGPDLAALLPPHLQTSAGAGSGRVKRDRGKEKRRPDLGDELYQSCGREWLPAHEAFGAAAGGNMLSAHLFPRIAHPLHMSGERDCEAMRCASAGFPPSSLADVGPALARGEVPEDRHCPVEEVADLRRCGRRHIAVNVALAHDSGEGMAVDTQGYSVAVWNSAVKEALREARRVRRDVWAARKAMRTAGAVPPPPAAPTPEPRTNHAERIEWYVALWRARLVHALALSAEGVTFANQSAAPYAASPPSDKALREEFFAEYFASLLELGAMAEAEAARRPPPPRNLVCYRSIAVSHARLGGFGMSDVRGSVSNPNVPTCHDAEGMKNLYEATVARFGACPAAPNAPITSDAISPSRTMAEQDVAQANNTNRDAHPLFTLPLAVQLRLAAAFASSQATVEAFLQSAESNEELLSALRSNEPLVALRIRVPAVRDLLGAVEGSMRSYDAMVMQYFARLPSDNSDLPRRTGGPAGRPISAYMAARLAVRQIREVRAFFTSATSPKDGGHSIADYVDFTAFEAFRPERPAPGAPSPRAEQYRRFLTTDLFYGPHGADFNAVAFLKPSALALEVGMEQYDLFHAPLRAGFFSQLVYARGVGFLRVHGHSMRIGKKEEQAVHLSLPEMRHTISTAVCSWLAMNAVRLGREASASRHNATGLDSYDHLVPWWCRGGALGAVEALREGLRARGAPPQRTNMGAASSERSALLAFALRRAETSFGFSVPMCPPLAPTVRFGGDGRAVWLSTAIGQSALNRLQNECARPVTLAARKTMRGSHLRAVEAHQTYLEVAAGLDQQRAAALATFVVRGVGDYPGWIWANASVSDRSCGLAHRGSNTKCHHRLLKAIFGLPTARCGARFVVAVRDALSALVPSVHFSTNASDPLGAAITSSNAVQRQRIFAFVAAGVARIAEHYHRDPPGPTDVTDEFSYGAKLQC